MREIWDSILFIHWSASEVAANASILLTLGGALVLGLIVGYERTFNGRAVGMRTYGMVCMASAALTIFAGYPSLWYGGHSAAVTVDPTRVVQGIVTGIGFLGAGIIQKEGLNIRGLTTAASVWSSSVIGILVGVGFYGAAIFLAGLSIICMLGGHRLENWLPTHSGISVVVCFKLGAAPLAETLQRSVHEHGYEIAPGTLSIDMNDGLAEWHFIATAATREKHLPMPELAQLLAADERIASFKLAHRRS